MKDEPTKPGQAAPSVSAHAEAKKNPGFDQIGQALSKALTRGTGRLVPVNMTVNVLNDRQVELVEWPPGGVAPISHGVYEL